MTTHNSYSIEQIAEKARKLIAQIPFSDRERIVFSTSEPSGDPIVQYQICPDGYYQVVIERGNERKNKVAQTSDEMVDYFVAMAIKDFAFDYELAHRRHFESNLRQVHEVMERCYQYINPAIKLVKESYDDEIHIYLDLFHQYQKIVQDYKQTYPQKYAKTKDDIDYILKKKYTDSPYGGMSNVPLSMKLVRERILRLSQFDPGLKAAFGDYEKYYELLPK